MKTPAYKRGSYKKSIRICDVCKESFEGTAKAKFCSNACKQADKHAKKKANILNNNTKN